MGQKMKSSFLFLITVIVNLASENQARAFTMGSTFSGQAGWPQKTLHFKVNPANCPAYINDVIDYALALWNGVATSRLTVKREGVTTATVSEIRNFTSNDTPVIACDPNFSTSFPALDPDFVAGVGGFRGSPINHGGLVLNVETGTNANINNANGAQLGIIIAHEIGHVLGLGHSADPHALMYYNAGAKATAALSQDDMDGITYLYPRNELSGDAILGCAAITSEISGPWSGLGRGPSPMTLLTLFATLATPLVIATALRRLSPRNLMGG
jgi:hypothetical protein